MEDGKTNAGELTIISSNPVVANALAGRVKRVRKYPSSNPVVAKALAWKRGYPYAGLRQADGGTAFIPLAPGTPDPNETYKENSALKVCVAIYKGDLAKAVQQRDNIAASAKRRKKAISKRWFDKEDEEEARSVLEAALRQMTENGKTAQKAILWVWKKDTPAYWKRMIKGTSPQHCPIQTTKPDLTDEISKPWEEALYDYKSTTEARKRKHK